MAFARTKQITSVNRTKLNGKQNQYIVIHYTGNRTDTAKANAQYFKSVDRGASAHYFVDKDSVFQVVEDADAAWSIGKNYGSGNLFGTIKNGNSINIELCSDNGKIADKTFSNAAELTKELMRTYRIPAENVYRHFDVCSKPCPGWKGWLPPDESLWNKFKASLAPSDAKHPNAVCAPLYRVRKSWDDGGSQTGAFSSLENAKAACQDGYSVYDENGTAVYAKPAKDPAQAGSCERFQVKLLDDLNVRREPNGKILQANGAKKGFIYTITETSGSWGRLKSGAGWISVSDKYVTRL